MQEKPLYSLMQQRLVFQFWFPSCTDKPSKSRKSTDLDVFLRIDALNHSLRYVQLYTSYILYNVQS